MFPEYKLEGQQRHHNVMDKQVDVFTPFIGDIVFSTIVNLQQTPEYANLKFGDRAPNVGEYIHKFPSMADAVFCHREYIPDGPLQQQYKFWFVVPPKNQWKYNAELKPASQQKNYTLILHKKDHERNLAIDPISAYMLPEDAEYVVPDGADENNGYYIVAKPDDVRTYYDITRTYVTLRPIEKKETDDGLTESFFKPIPLRKIYSRDPDSNYSKQDCFYVQKLQSRISDRRFDNVFVEEQHRYLSLPGPVEYRPLYQNSASPEDPVVNGSAGHSVQRNTMAHIVPPMPYECFYDEDGKEKEVLYEWEDFGGGGSDIPAVKKFSLITPYIAAGRYSSQNDSDREDATCCDIPDRYIKCKYVGNITMMRAIYKKEDYDDTEERGLPSQEDKREEVIEQLKAQIEKRVNDKQLKQEQEQGSNGKWAITSMSWDVDWRDYHGNREEIEVACKYTYVNYETESLESWRIGNSGKRVHSKSYYLTNEDEKTHEPPYTDLQSVTKQRVNGCGVEVAYEERDDGKDYSDDVIKNEALQKTPESSTTDALSRSFSDTVTLLVGEATDAQKVFVEGNLDEQATLRNMAKDTILHYQQLHESLLNDWRNEIDDDRISFLDSGHETHVDLKETKATVNVKTSGTLTRWTTNASIGFVSDELTGIKDYQYEVTSFKEAVEALFGISIKNETVALEENANPLAKRALYVSYEVNPDIEAQWVSASDLDGFRIERITLANNGERNGEDMYVYRVVGSGKGPEEETLLFWYEGVKQVSVPQAITYKQVDNTNGFFKTITKRSGMTKGYVNVPAFYLEFSGGLSVWAKRRVFVFYVPKGGLEAFRRKYSPRVFRFSGAGRRIVISHPLLSMNFEGLYDKWSFTLSNGDSFAFPGTGVTDWKDDYMIDVSVSKSKNGFTATVEEVSLPPNMFSHLPIPSDNS